jgi:hypothetical protein
MARKVKDYAPLERKRRKRPGRHSKSPNKSFKLQQKKYHRQGRV